MQQHSHNRTLTADQKDNKMQDQKFGEYLVDSGESTSIWLQSVAQNTSVWWQQSMVTNKNNNIFPKQCLHQMC